MTRCTSAIAAALLGLFVSAPVLAKNYSLHSPKLWTPEEMELFEKSNDPPAKEPAEPKKELQTIRLHTKHPQKDKAPAREQASPGNENRILVENGVSFREVTVKKGESLFRISLRYRNEGVTYAGILKLNGIKNPDRIAIGDIVRIPVVTDKTPQQKKPAKQSKRVAAAAVKQPPAKPADIVAKESVLEDANQSNSTESHAPAADNQDRPDQPDGTGEAQPLPAPPPPSTATKLPIVSNYSASGNNLFEQGVRAYRNNDCQNAIQLFGRFLAENKNSSLAPDVSAFIADCYVKLSGK